MYDQEDQKRRLEAILRILDELRVQTQDGLPGSPAMEALIREIDNLNGSREWHERFSFVDDVGKRERALKVLQALVEKERESPTLH
ncbi:MAG: hypothetical protein HQL76_14660 [Magnetococcales bacterium]|nr:hypothetical protein [Magnetococcales bacterium]